MTISITGDGIAIPIDGNVGMTYDRATKTITITGLDQDDRVIHRTATGAGPYEQSVIVQLGAASG